MCYWLQHTAKENPARRKVSSNARKGGMCHWLQHTAKKNPNAPQCSSM
jgi:hypothetical protein